MILHDLCKIQEMKSDSLGNVQRLYPVMDCSLDTWYAALRSCSWRRRMLGVEGEIVLLLEHMILSHHGEAEYGSPRMPMFPEAEALHWIDLLDAPDE